ncbi:hypothetical protein OIO90_002776 [Microbotryomycetes sp. JL221]|nr:hypothetical protein OIO90_002776 [Microbotryomycetes sp. JL221]
MPSNNEGSVALTNSVAANFVAFEDDPATQKFVIGKIDAGIAVLISDSVHLIEFPSLLLPSGVGPGSIVNITCTRNTVAERDTNKAFWDLQNEIFTEYGAEEPQPPKLRIRNTTQTSVTLEWDKLELAKAKLLGLSIWRNGQRLTTIPNPLNNTSTKLSGLSLDTDYTFHLVMKTTAGTLSSPILKTRTHTINDTSGLSVCFGHVEPSKLLSDAQDAIRDMKAKFSDKIQIDTTHFVATSPATPSNPTGGPGPEYQKALQLSIPVVSPEWVLACQREQKMVPISNYYIGSVNHAASLSSAQLVTSTGQIPPSKPIARKATTATIPEQPEQQQQQQQQQQQRQTGNSNAAPASKEPTSTPAVPPAPTSLSRTELAEEEPEAPPADSVAAIDSGAVATMSQDAAPAPEAHTFAVDAPEEPATTLGEAVIAPPKSESPTIKVTGPDEDVVEQEHDEPSQTSHPVDQIESTPEASEIVEDEHVTDLSKETEQLSLDDENTRVSGTVTSGDDALVDTQDTAAIAAPSSQTSPQKETKKDDINDEDEMEEVGLQ